MSNELKLILDDTKLQEAFSQALLTQLNEKARENIIAQAVAYLTRDRGYNYGNTSPLQEAFNEACKRLAFSMAMDYVKQSPEFHAAIEKSLEQIAATVLSSDETVRGFVVDAVTEAISNQWRRRDE